jgi:hypothetical protein
VVVVSVGHVVAEPDGEHPGPCHCAVFWICVPPGVAGGTSTEKPRVTLAPAPNPLLTVHVIVPLFSTTVHEGVDDEFSTPHVGDPPTSVVPAGTVSVTTTGAVVGDSPVLSTTKL